MKYRLMIACLALTLLLSACGIVPDEYVHVVPHEDSYAQSEGEQEEIVANNNAELREAVFELIRAGTEEATITSDVYSDDLEADFDQLQAYVTHDDPERAYLVGSIDREITRAGSYSKIDLKIQYRHKNADLEGIEPAVTMDDVQKHFEEALENNQERLLLHVYNYAYRDFERMAEEYADTHLTTVAAKPLRILKETYPADGSERVLELRFEYPYKVERLNSYQMVVGIMIDAAKDSVIDEPNELEKARLIYASQLSGHIYSEGTTLTPAYSLFIDRKGDSRVFSAVYQAMCEKAEVTDVITVHGTKDGEPYDWNILDLDSGVWHVDVNADAQSGAPELRLMTDAEMAGYEWDTDAYPACVGLYAPVEPIKDEDHPAEGEQSQEEPNGQQEPEPAPEPPEEENPIKPENTP